MRGHARGRAVRAIDDRQLRVDPRGVSAWEVICFHRGAENRSGARCRGTALMGMGPRTKGEG